ncbi:hypothetical protein E3H11_43765, partial [Bradyrhizobium brasilense]|nr:hypothetical protein [Bradyrhizobium brasilense]
DIVNGIVKRVEYGSVIVDLGRGEAIVRRDEMLPREVFRNGDRLDLDDAVVNLRHFLREQLRHELRMGARQENLRTAGLTAD